MKFKHRNNDIIYKGMINWVDEYEPVSKEEFDRDIEKWKEEHKDDKEEEEEK